MSSYISSIANRFYAAVEGSFGAAAPVTAAQRFPASRLEAHQTLQRIKRLDKLGTRTYQGAASSARRITAFEVQTYLVSWNAAAPLPYGPLFEAALGAPPSSNTALTVSAAPSPTQVQTTAPHGLSVGAAVSAGGELRFVTSVIDSTTMVVNAPFTALIQAGSTLAPTVTCRLSTGVPSLTLYDYWDPITALSRLVTGAAVDVLQISLDGDFHEFTFSGPACDLLDSSTFVSGAAGLTAFPAEPALGNFEYSVVPGQLGQVWLGGSNNQFFTLTTASVSLKNNLQMRGLEFGSAYPRAISAGEREVSAQFELLAQDDAQTIALYAAAKNRTPVPAMIQLGREQGHLMGIYLPAMVPEIPTFDDSKARLQWTFDNNLAQGRTDDELVIAFA